MIDLAAAVSGFGHHAQGDNREDQDEIQRPAGKTPKVAIAPQNHPGGAAGKGEAKKR